MFYLRVDSHRDKIRNDLLVLNSLKMVLPKLVISFHFRLYPCLLNIPILVFQLHVDGLHSTGGGKW